MEYIDDMVIDGFFSSIEGSLKFFLDNTGRMSLNRHTCMSVSEKDMGIVMFPPLTQNLCI